MGFVYEVVPEEDREFFKSMGLRDCWGKDYAIVTEYTTWCADRDNNIYLVGIGGGYKDIPYYYALWLNGQEIRLEVTRRGKCNSDGLVDIIWYINRIPITEKMTPTKYDLIEIINKAFLVNRGGYSEKDIGSITIKFMCKPEMKEV